MYKKKTGLKNKRQCGLTKDPGLDKKMPPHERPLLFSKRTTCTGARPANDTCRGSKMPGSLVPGLQG